MGGGGGENEGLEDEDFQKLQNYVIVRPSQSCRRFGGGGGKRGLALVYEQLMR